MTRSLVRFYAIGFTILVLFDTLVQLSFKYAGDHAFPPEANWAWVQPGGSGAPASAKKLSVLPR